MSPRSEARRGSRHQVHLELLRTGRQCASYGTWIPGLGVKEHRETYLAMTTTPRNITPEEYAHPTP